MRALVRIVAIVTIGAAVSLAVPTASADPGDMWTIAGGGAVDPVLANTPSGDGGPAVAANLVAPSGVAVDSDGSVVVADTATHVIRRIGTDGVIRHVAGSTVGYSGDGGPAASARLHTPGDVEIDPSGGFVFVDEGNARIRKVWPNGTITTIAGNGSIGSRFGDGVPATAVPVNATRITFAPDGRLYLTESQRVSVIEPAGTISTVASGFSYSGDLEVDSMNRVYVANGTSVWRLDGGGTRTLVAGLGVPGTTADGVPATSATLTTALGLALAPNGDLYVGDLADGRIRRISSGVIDTVAGGGAAGVTAAGCTSARSSERVQTAWLAATSTSLVFSGDQRVRVIALDGRECPSITSVTPTRVLETRASEGQIGYLGPSPSRGQVVRLSFAGSSLVPATAQAVALNVTVTGALADGYVTVWPCESTMPTASNVNVTRGGTAANAAIVKLGPSRELCFFVQAGGDVLADLTGFVGVTVPYQALVPFRALETRSDVGRINHQGDKPAEGQTVRVSLSGFGIGANRVSPFASALVLNVTATEATADGFVTVWSCEGTRPTASNINLVRGGTVGRMVVTELGTATTAFGTAREICIFTQSGTHLAVDVLGVFMPDAPFAPLAPNRLLETRADVGQIGYAGARPVAGQVVEIDVVGRSAGAVTPDARAVVLSVTATNPVAAGFVTVWPCGAPRPRASSLNLSGPGDTQSNAVVVGLGTNGRVCVFTQSGTDLIADLNGAFP